MYSFIIIWISENFAGGVLSRNELEPLLWSNALT